MFRFLAKFGVITLTLALMVYSSVRTFDFLKDTLPAGSEALAVFGVLAFDAALIIWLAVFMWDSEGAGQRGIAAGMVCFQLVAILVGFGGDSLLRSADNGLISGIDEQTRRLILYSTIVVIFANVASATFYHLLSPSNRARMRQEGYKEKIESKAHEVADKDVDSLAAQLALEMSGSTMKQLTAQYRSMIVDQELQAAQQEDKNGVVNSVRSWLKGGNETAPGEMKTLSAQGEDLAPVAVEVAAQPAKNKGGRPRKSR